MQYGLGKNGRKVSLKHFYLKNLPPNECYSENKSYFYKQFQNTGICLISNSKKTGETTTAIKKSNILNL